LIVKENLNDTKIGGKGGDFNTLSDTSFAQNATRDGENVTGWNGGYIPNFAS
jgi:hypothetical protein